MGADEVHTIGRARVAQPCHPRHIVASIGATAPKPAGGGRRSADHRRAGICAFDRIVCGAEQLRVCLRTDVAYGPFPVDVGLVPNLDGIGSGSRQPCYPACIVALKAPFGNHIGRSQSAQLDLEALRMSGGDHARGVLTIVHLHLSPVHPRVVHPVSVRQSGVPDVPPQLERTAADRRNDDRRAGSLVLLLFLLPGQDHHPHAPAVEAIHRLHPPGSLILPWISGGFHLHGDVHLLSRLHRTHLDAFRCAHLLATGKRQHGIFRPGTTAVVPHAPRLLEFLFVAQLRVIRNRDVGHEGGIQAHTAGYLLRLGQRRGCFHGLSQLNCLRHPRRGRHRRRRCSRSCRLRHRDNHRPVLEARDRRANLVASGCGQHHPRIPGVSKRRHLFLCPSDAPSHFERLPCWCISASPVRLDRRRDALSVSCVQQVGNGDATQVILLRPAQLGGETGRGAKPRRVRLPIIRHVLKAIGTAALLACDAQQRTREAKVQLGARLDLVDFPEGHYLAEGRKRLVKRDVLNALTALFGAQRGNHHAQLVAGHTARGPIQQTLHLTTFAVGRWICRERHFDHIGGGTDGRPIISAHIPSAPNRHWRLENDVQPQPFDMESIGQGADKGRVGVAFLKRSPSVVHLNTGEAPLDAQLHDIGDVILLDLGHRQHIRE